MADVLYVAFIISVLALIATGVLFLNSLADNERTAMRRQDDADAAAGKLRPYAWRHVTLCMDQWLKERKDTHAD